VKQGRKRKGTGGLRGEKEKKLKKRQANTSFSDNRAAHGKEKSGAGRGQQCDDGVDQTIGSGKFLSQQDRKNALRRIPGGQEGAGDGGASAIAQSHLQDSTTTWKRKGRTKKSTIREGYVWLRAEEASNCRVKKTPPLV